MSDDLTPIITYSLKPLEAIAYKIALLWLEVSRKELPNYRFGRDGVGSGDPRKSHLFKICHKLVHDTNGRIELHDYRLYIAAQIQTLKEVSDGKIHALIGPECLIGERAWNRWVMWKEKLDFLMSSQMSANLVNPQHAKPSFVILELKRTKKFFMTAFQDKPDWNLFQAMVKTRLIRKWLTCDKISNYWAVQSPWLLKIVPMYKFDEVMGIDPEVFLPSCTLEINQFFASEFSYELA
jgi:hypothetical protein